MRLDGGWTTTTTALVEQDDHNFYYLWRGGNNKNAINVQPLQNVTEGREYRQYVAQPTSHGRGRQNPAEQVQQTNEDVLLEDPVSEFAQWRLTAERASLSIPSRAVPLRIFMRHILI